MRTLILTAALGAAALSAPAFAQAAGEWTVTVPNIQGGTIETTWTLVDAEGSDSVTITPPAGAPAMESTISEVVVDGGSFSFKRVLTTPQGSIELSYAGTVEGDAMTGAISSSFGENQFTGVRK